MPSNRCEDRKGQSLQAQGIHQAHTSEEADGGVSSGSQQASDGRSGQDPIAGEHQPEDQGTRVSGGISR